MNYAQEHGYIVVGVYADEGVSARKAISRRKELQRMLADVDEGRIDIIIIKCLDRWFRNVADFYKVKERLDARGVDWVCATEDFNTTTPNGLLMLNLKLSLAQHESDQTGERIKYVFEGKRARKEVISGSLPIGLKVENKHAVPDDNAPIIQFLFNHIYNGDSIRASIAATQSEFGVSLSYKIAQYALRNRAYVGELYGVPDYLPAMIPHDVFSRVQDILSRNANPPRTGNIYLFSGLLRCPSCGHRLSACKGRPNRHGEFRAPQYKCMSYILGNSTLCEFSRSIFEPKLERYLLDNFQRLIREHIVTIEEMNESRSKNHPEDRLSALTAKQSRLDDIFLEGLIDKEKYAATYKELSREISELSAQVDTAPAIPSALRAIVDDRDFRATYDSLTRENKQRFWKSIISSITFEDTLETRGKGAYIPFKVVFYSIYDCSNCIFPFEPAKTMISGFFCTFSIAFHPYRHTLSIAPELIDGLRLAVVSDTRHTSCLILCQCDTHRRASPLHNHIIRHLCCRHHAASFGIFLSLYHILIENTRGTITAQLFPL